MDVDFDLLYDPNEVRPSGTVMVRVSRAPRPVDPRVGDEVWAGDGEEPRLHAVVVSRDGDRVELQLSSTIRPRPVVAETAHSGL